MARSRRHTPVFSNTMARSERWDKQDWHRRYRRDCRRLARQLSEDYPHIYDHSNPWAMSKDGKGYYRNYPPEYMRK